MVICFRCQVNISEYECEICNGFYCAECDKFIHSKKPKNGHIRKQLTVPNKISTEKKIQNIPIYNGQNMNFNKSDFNPNNNINNIISENKKNDYQKDLQYFSQTYQIENRNNQSNVYRPPENYSQQIIEERNNSDELSKNMNNCIETINNIMNEEYTFNPDEKDSEIKALLKQISDQRILINNLKQENNNLEQDIEKTNSELDILYQEKDRLINKKRTINEFYSYKQNEIEKVHELEKYKLIEDYENQMREISQNYLNKKTECLKSMQDIEDKMREIENAKEEEKRTMYDEIDRLKNEGNNIEKEQEYLMKSNDELNHKLKETSNNIDLLRANTLGSNTLKSKGKKKIKNK